jgi:hypothetical protein
VVTGLPPRAATRLGHDRGDHVDQPSQAADAHHLTPRTAPHSISQLPQGILRRNPRDDLNNPPLQPFKATLRNPASGSLRSQRSAERDTPRRLSVRCRLTAPDQIPRRRTYRRRCAPRSFIRSEHFVTPPVPPSAAGSAKSCGRHDSPSPARGGHLFQFVNDEVAALGCCSDLVQGVAGEGWPAPAPLGLGHSALTGLSQERGRMMMSDRGRGSG